MALVVLGMHRSGTSAMARVLSLCGAALPSNMMRPAAANELGFWEPQDVANLNDKILGDLDSDWAAMFGPRRNRKGEVPARKYLEKARTVIRTNWSDDALIVVKEPRVSMLVDLWSEALRAEGYRPVYVIMVRHPGEVADSLKARYGITRNQSLLLWSTYMLAAETGTRNAPRLFLSFDDLLLNPEAALDRVEIELDINLPRRSWRASAEIESFLRADARHHDSKGRPELTGLPTIQRYYEFLQSACAGASWNEDISAELSNWIASLEQTVGPILAGMENHIRLTQRELAAEREKTAEAQTRIEAAEQTLARREAELTAELMQLRESLSGVELDLAAEREKSAEAQTRIESAEATLAAREAELTAELMELRESLSGVELDLAAEREKSAEAQTWIESAEATLAAREAELTAELMELRESLSGVELDLAAEREKSAEAQTRIEAAEATLAAREAQLTAELMELRERLSGFESDLGAERQKSQDAQSRIAMAEQTLAKRNAELINADKKLEKLTSRLLAREADFAVSMLETQKRFDQTEEKLAKLSTTALATNAEAQHVLAVIRERLAEVEQKNKTLLDSLQVKVDQECSLREELTHLIQMRSDDQREIEKLNLILSKNEEDMVGLRKDKSRILQDAEKLAGALSNAVAEPRSRTRYPVEFLRRFMPKLSNNR